MWNFLTHNLLSRILSQRVQFNRRSMKIKNYLAALSGMKIMHTLFFDLTANLLLEGILNN